MHGFGLDIPRQNYICSYTPKIEPIHSYRSNHAFPMMCVTNKGIAGPYKELVS